MIKILFVLLVSTACLLTSSCGSTSETKVEKKEFTQVTTKAELEKELSNNKVVLIDFYADWCGPCKKLAPHLVKLDKTHGKTIKIIKVNVDNAQELAKEYQISSIPALYLIKDKKINKKELGYQNYEQLVDFIK